MPTTNKKQTSDSHTKKQKEHKHQTKGNHPTAKRKRNKEEI